MRDVNCDLMSISPKLANSTPSRSRAGDWASRHENARHRPDVVNQLISRHDYQLKFVVSQPSDLEEIEQYLELLPGVHRHRVLLMPEGVEASQLAERETWLLPACDEHQFTYCPRMHIHWYGNKRGTTKNDRHNVNRLPVEFKCQNDSQSSDRSHGTRNERPDKSGKTPMSLLFPCS